jgi:tetratricopeptide (TPR) repeat protein
MQIAERVHLVAQEQNDAGLWLQAYRALACTLFYLGEFETARQYAMRGVQIWRSGNVESHTEEPYTPVVACLCFLTHSEWHLGEVASNQANLDEAISIAKRLNDMSSLAIALYWAAVLAANQRNLAEVDRLASDLIELSTRENFALWLAIGAVFRGWARSASGNTVEGIPWIEQGIRDFQATGTVLAWPLFLALKAEALYLANCTSEALATINVAEAVAERFEQRVSFADLHRLRGVFLTAIGADDTQIEASFRTAISSAEKQKSVSLAKRAEATYAEYRRQKASGSGERGFRLPIC